MIRLDFKVVGQGTNIQLVRLDEDGNARSARPGSPEELFLYEALMRTFGTVEHLEDQHLKDMETIDRQAEELDWTRGVANNAEEELSKANAQLEEIKAALNELKPEKGNGNE